LFTKPQVLLVLLNKKGPIEARLLLAAHPNHILGIKPAGSTTYG